MTGRPLAAGLASAALLAALAIPALDLRVGTGALRELAPGNEARVGFQRAADVVGVGNLAPVHVELSFRSGGVDAPGNRAAVDAVVRGVAHDPGVAQVSDVLPARDGGAVLITAAPRGEGESEQTKRLVRRLRTVATRTPGSDARLGGIAAGELEFQHLVTDSIWKLAILISGLAFLALVPVLRSILLPLKAALLTLLSLASAYGVLVIVFQLGWFDGLLGYRSPGYVNALALPLVLALVVGLSMDYEVFLMLRIRERFDATGDTRKAVAEALALTARPVTSAALIMVAVFAVFVATGVTTIKQIGLGNAVAIGLDATLVRLVLVPALVIAFGRWNWWLPAWLDRILPRRAWRRA